MATGSLGDIKDELRAHLRALFNHTRHPKKSITLVVAGFSPRRFPRYNERGLKTATTLVRRANGRIMIRYAPHRHRRPVLSRGKNGGQAARSANGRKYLRI